MDGNEFEGRLVRLEEQLTALQGRAGGEVPETEGSRSVRISKFLVANWVLLSFVVALGTAVYVKFAFGVDYFRDYRSIQAKNNLTAFYTHLGDVLMGRLEFAAAEEAYRNALQLDGSNTTATLGVVKAQVFKKEDGQEFYAPEVADAKLAYLRSAYPEDDQLMFLQGIRLDNGTNVDEAMAWYKKAIAKNPRSMGSYGQLAYHYMNPPHFDLDEAMKNLKSALELDPDLPQLNENMGYIFLLLQDYPQAEKYLSKGYKLAPTWEKASSWADLARSEGNVGWAIALRRWSLGAMTAAKPKDRVFDGTTSWNYMPLKPGDRETIKDTVLVESPEEKRAFTHYELSLDYAVQGRFKKADEELALALKGDPEHEYTDYFAEVSESVRRLVPASKATKVWLQADQAALAKLTP